MRRLLNAVLRLVALPVVLASSSASASVAKALTLSELVLSSDIVAVVTPLSSTVVGSRPAELARKLTVRVDECVVGACGQSLEIFLRGGDREGLSKVVPGEASLLVGQPAVVFLRRDGASGPWQVVGLSQGAFDVVTDGTVSTVRRSLHGLSLVGGRCDQSSWDGLELSCGNVVFEQRLDAFLSRVRHLSH